MIFIIHRYYHRNEYRFLDGQTLSDGIRMLVGRGGGAGAGGTVVVHMSLSTVTWVGIRLRAVIVQKEHCPV